MEPGAVIRSDIILGENTVCTSKMMQNMNRKTLANKESRWQLPT